MSSSKTEPMSALSDPIGMEVDVREVLRDAGRGGWAFARRSICVCEVEALEDVARRGCENALDVAA
jgi:hypothetical protein